MYKLADFSRAEDVLKLALILSVYLMYLMTVPEEIVNLMSG